MNMIDQQIVPQILEGNINPDDLPQELDYWTVEDFEDLLPECAQ